MLPYTLNADAAGTDLPGGLETLNDFALSAGKRFRPKLLLKTAECLGVDLKTAEPYAVAAERIHNATLLHDDVIDESASRRGKPTLNASGKNRQAILGGDLLLARTLRDLGAGGRFDVLRDALDVLVELAEGEWLQLEARYRLDVGERHLREVARKKTASLIGWCCATPARLAGRIPSCVESLRNLGRHLGVAFQLADDCLDFDRSSGKPFAQDLREGQVNFVIQDLLEFSPGLRPTVQALLADAAAPEPSAALVKALGPSLRRVLAKAAVEAAAVEEELRRCGLGAEIEDRLRREILKRFTTQLDKTAGGLR